MPETRTSGDVTYRCQYRVTWCTKYRRPLIDAEVESRLRGIVEAVCAERGAQPTRLDILGDRVDMVLECAPQESIHKVVKAIKARSSRALREEFARVRSRLPTLWTNSYYVATLGEDPSGEIADFIAAQPRS